MNRQPFSHWNKPTHCSDWKAVALQKEKEQHVLPGILIQHISLPIATTQITAHKQSHHARQWRWWWALLLLEYSAPTALRISSHFLGIVCFPYNQAQSLLSLEVLGNRDAELFPGRNSQHTHQYSHST